MTAQVHIVLGRAEDVLTLPSVALGQIAADGTQTVRVQTRDGQIETRQVRIGLNDRVNAEVVEGLSEGDRVVTGQAADRAAGGSGGGSMRRPPMGF